MPCNSACLDLHADPPLLSPCPFISCLTPAVAHFVPRPQLTPPVPVLLRPQGAPPQHYGLGSQQDHGTGPALSDGPEFEFEPAFTFEFEFEFGRRRARATGCAGGGAADALGPAAGPEGTQALGGWGGRAWDGGWPGRSF